MPLPARHKRTRFFIAVEGESEQSFVRWLQFLADRHMQVHLDAILLGGGGYKSMLEKAVRGHKHRYRTKGAYRKLFLIVDSDRAAQGDWPLEQLRREAAEHQIIVCVQRPNHEGLLLRMLPGRENETPTAADAERKLAQLWPAYRKPMNAHALGRQFSLDDLRKLAAREPDLAELLNAIGLMAG